MVFGRISYGHCDEVVLPSVFVFFFFLNMQFKTIVEERDQERERRWKAEQAVRKLTEDLKCLQTKVTEEKDLQSMAVHTTDR